MISLNQLKRKRRIVCSSVKFMKQIQLSRTAILMISLNQLKKIRGLTNLYMSGSIPSGSQLIRTLSDIRLE